MSVTTTTVIEPEMCGGCGRYLPVPADGQWRWAQSGKIFPRMGQAEAIARKVNGHRAGWEAMAARDERGCIRIATRRRTDAA